MLREGVGRGLRTGGVVGIAVMSRPARSALSDLGSRRGRAVTCSLGAGANRGFDAAGSRRGVLLAHRWTERVT